MVMLNECPIKRSKKAPNPIKTFQDTNPTRYRLGYFYERFAAVTLISGMRHGKFILGIDSSGLRHLSWA